MKIAICFSGMIRTGIETSENIKNFIGDVYDSCDFFMHTWDIDYQNPLRGQLWDHPHIINRDISLDYTKLERLNKIYKFKDVEIDNYWQILEKHKIEYSKYIEGIEERYWWSPLFYSWWRSIKLKQLYEVENKFRYKYVIKIRPDMIFSEDLKLYSILDKISNMDFAVNQIYIDKDGSIVDDIFFACSSHVMDLVSNLWEYKIKSIDFKEEFSQDFFFKYIIHHGLNPKSLELNYLSETYYTISLYREESLMFNPVTEFNKCVESDRIHYHTLNACNTKYIEEWELIKLSQSTMERRHFLPNNLSDYNENSNLF